jgi:HAD superfamily hydrolase (TIGR01509 family)
MIQSVIRGKKIDCVMIEAVIFDMDGVLADSEPLIKASATQMFLEKGYTVEPDDFNPFVGTGELRFIGGVAEKYGIELDLEAAKSRTYEIYLDLVPEHLNPYPGGKELFEECRSRGLKLALASSADRMKIDANLNHIDLAPALWDAVVSGEEVTRKKPAPDIFMIAASKLGVAPSACVVIEDAVHGVQAAKSAGMHCVGVAQTFPREHLSEADWVVNNLTELTVDLLTAF